MQNDPHAYRKDEFHRRLAALSGVAPGERILDAGCGAGDTLTCLSAAAGPQGLVLGMDVLPGLLARAAQHQSPGIGLVRADAEAGLPFRDQAFERIICNNVLECLCDKPHFLRECLRVTRPGGSLLLAHFDFDSVVLNSSLPSVTRRLVHGYSDAQQPWMTAADGQLGRKLPEILSRAGLVCEEFGVELFVERSLRDGYAQGMLADMRACAQDCGLAASDAQRWWEDLLALDAVGGFLFTIQWMYARCRT